MVLMIIDNDWSVNKRGELFLEKYLIGPYEKLQRPGTNTKYNNLIVIISAKENKHIVLTYISLFASY